MPGLDVVFAEFSADPISVDQATAAVQGDEAGAVVSWCRRGPALPRLTPIDGLAAVSV